ncbi:MAG: hypothetical protein K0R03_1056, partial [Moraxellaceae bacterium]|nr:hypothetical protein [Moraxellaceae bacterium]
PELFRGSAYAFVSGWLSRVFSNGRVPAVPHIVTLPETEGDLRAELGIPADATVFGCHGGKECFDIPFVHRTVEAVLAERPDIWFVFMNIAAFTNHPRAVFLPGTADAERKVRFIDTCDAMLHGRKRGETFGLAVAEFSIRNKPVLTYALSGERNHIGVLGQKGLLYKVRRGLHPPGTGQRRRQHREPRPDRGRPHGYTGEPRRHPGHQADPGLVRAGFLRRPEPG